MQPSSSRTTVHVFLVLGLVAIFLGLLIPILLVREVQSERARFAACQRRERIDCDPSFLWSLMK